MARIDLQLSQLMLPYNFSSSGNWPTAVSSWKLDSRFGSQFLIKSNYPVKCSKHFGKLQCDRGGGRAGRGRAMAWAFECSLKPQQAGKVSRAFWVGDALRIRHAGHTGHAAIQADWKIAPILQLSGHKTAIQGQIYFPPRSPYSILDGRWSQKHCRWRKVREN